MVSVLIAEKNMELARKLEVSLSGTGYRTEIISGPSPAEVIRKNFSLVIGNIDTGGAELCRELRNAGSKVPFLMLVDGTVNRQRRQAFHSGADGYLPLPPDGEELVMHVKNLLWRCNVETETMLEFDDCVLRSDTYTVESPDAAVELRHMEFLLLEKLLSYPGRVFTRAQIMDDLWGYDCESDPRTVDTHIKRLRKKLKGIDAIRIQTIRGIGYRAALPRRSRNGKA